MRKFPILVLAVFLLMGFLGASALAFNTEVRNFLVEGCAIPDDQVDWDGTHVTAYGLPLNIVGLTNANGTTYADSEAIKTALFKIYDVKVRDYLRDTMRIPDDDIQYNDDYKVTAYGITLEIAKLINVDKRTYTTNVQNIKDAVLEQFPLNVRDYLVNMGISDSQIGFNENSNKVTLKGIDLDIAQTVNYNGQIYTAYDGNILNALNQFRVNGVSLNYTSLTLPIGSIAPLVASVSPSYALNKTVTWHSDNPDVIQVANGILKAVGLGTAEVTVRTDEYGYTASCRMTVTSAPSGADVRLDKTSLTLKTGETQRLLAEVLPEGSDQRVNWTTGDANIATVTDDGIVTGISKGSTEITVITYDRKHTASCWVTVDDGEVPPYGLSLNKSEMVLRVGTSEKLIAKVFPDYASNQKVTWKTGNSKIATVSSDGNVVAVGVGQTKIIATTADGKYSASCVVTTVLNTPKTQLSVEMYHNSMAVISNVLHPNFKITNKGTTAINLSDIKIRYYYTIDGDRPQKFWCNWSPVGTGNVTGKFIKMDQAMVGADTYLEIGFLQNTGKLQPNASTTIQVQIAKDDWSVYDQRNDYSYNNESGNYISWNRGGAYVAGILMPGMNPPSEKVPTGYPGMSVEMYNTNRAETTNTLSPRMRLLNTGSLPLDLSQVKVRYYFTREQYDALKFWCDWSNIGTEKVTGKFVFLTDGDSSADSYLELGFKADAGILPTNSMVEIQFRITKDNWRDFRQTNDFSFNRDSSDFTRWINTPAYYGGKQLFGHTPSTAASGPEQPKLTVKSVSGSTITVEAEFPYWWEPTNTVYLFDPETMDPMTFSDKSLTEGSNGTYTAHGLKPNHTYYVTMGWIDPEKNDLQEINLNVTTEQTSLERKNGTKVVVILASYNDHALRFTDKVWHDRIFGTTGETLYAYYRQSSVGNYNITPAEETSGVKNDGVIRISMGKNFPTGDIDWAAEAKTAIHRADPSLQAGQFDVNGDSKITTSELKVIIVYAGYDSPYDASASKYVPGWIWAPGGLILDNLELTDYIQLPEASSAEDPKIADLGGYCHEFGHALGGIDMYHAPKDHPKSVAAGPYSIMGDCWSDTYLDPFHKIMFGFVKPTVVTAANADYTLYSFDPAHPERYNVLKIPTANPKEYFLIENREFVGFDTNLNKSSKNGGILIWHIDESMLVDGSPRNFFDIEEANEGILGYSQLDSGTEIDPANGVYRDPFFYLGGQRIFSPWSTPGTQLYSGGQGNFTVIVKSEPGEAMVVNVQLL